MVELGFLSAYFNGQDLQTTLASMAKYGYTMVEVGAQPGHAHFKANDILSGKAVEFKRMISQQGFTISALCSHVDHLAQDEDRRKRNNDFFKRNIEAASAIDVDVLTTFSGSPSRWQKPGATEWVLFKEVFDDLTDFAKQHGCKIAIEVHFGSMTYNIDTMRRMFDVVPAKNLGLNFDPSHFLWQLIDASAASEMFPDRMFHVHAKDVKVYWDKIRTNGINDRAYYEQRMPGWGDFDWRRFILFLLAETECEVLSVEHEDTLFFGETGFIKAAEFLRPLLV